MKAIIQKNRFIPNMGQLCALIRPLRSKEKEWNWTKTHDSAIEQIKKAKQAVTEIQCFKQNQPMRTVCDASRKGLNAVLQQKREKGGKANNFPSRVLTTFEQKYSINELELLAVVWAVENFRNYVYGAELEVVSDHKALTSILKGNGANKTFSSRFARWVDRLSQFHFIVIHEPGRTLGIAYYLSRHPSPSNVKNQRKAEQSWNDWFKVNAVRCKEPVSDEQKSIGERKQPITNEVAGKKRAHENEVKRQV